MNFWLLFFSFSGRISRKTYWLAVLPLALLHVVILGLLAWQLAADPFSMEIWLLTPENRHIWGPVMGIALAITIWPAFALMVKRMHDRGYSGWIVPAWYLVSILPLLLQATGITRHSPQHLDLLYFLTSLLIVPIHLWYFVEIGFIRGRSAPTRTGQTRSMGLSCPRDEASFTSCSAIMAVLAGAPGGGCSYFIWCSF